MFFATHLVTLKCPDRPHEVRLTLAALGQQIVQGETFAPETLIRRDEHWMPLTHFPDRPWDHELLGMILTAYNTNDAGRVQSLADKLLRFNTHDDSREMVRHARFFLGCLRAAEGRYREAITAWEAVVRGPSRLLVAAHNNLGVALAELRQPESADENFEMASALCPELIAPHLSRRTLAEVLVAEQAPNRASRPRWSDVVKSESAWLKHVPAAVMREQLDPQRTFLNYRQLIILPPGPRFPHLSSQMSLPETGQAAARTLLERAQAAMHDGRFALAEQLGRAAARLSPTLKPVAGRLVAEAAQQRETQDRLESARSNAKLLAAYFTSLEQLSLEALDAPRELLALLRPTTSNLENLEQFYRTRVVALVSEAADQTLDQARRTQLMTMAARFADGEESASLLSAVRWRRAAPALRDFRNAVFANDIDAALVHLVNAEQVIEDKLVAQSQLLNDLQPDCNCSHARVFGM